MAANAAKTNKPAPKKRGGEVFTWIFDLAFLAALICFFQNPSNCAMAWRWACQSLEQPAVYLISKCPFLVPSSPPPVQSSDVADDRPQAANHAPAEEGSKIQEPQTPADVEVDKVTTEPEQESTPEVALVPTAPATEVKPASKPVKIVRGGGKPVQCGKGKIHGVPFYQTIINLKDPETFLTIGLPNKAEEANSNAVSHGHENFDSLVKRYPGAVVVNGTFFSKDQQERVMGNVVSQGRFLKYSQWEDYGTTLGLKAGNEPEMVTARAEGKPNWDEHWFSITCGPRLVKEGEVWLSPEGEGFTDSHVLNIGPRAAIGFNKKKDKLFIVTFMNGLSLEREAELMKELGCYEAMNLDGGASKALAANGKVMVAPGRALTNVIVVYDTKHPAPDSVVSSWLRFKEGEHAQHI
ncbi:MAG: phosphodiester glycosidase family protein [Candidatus Obscuribacterales bacterium]|nr:phosphodiester glycosidase family protein [Candidatus Obscuribacterales bacterium]